LLRIPDRRSLRIGSETTQADVEAVPDVGGRTGIAPAASDGFSVMCASLKLAGP
jgi:hypothetical protein